MEPISIHKIDNPSCFWGVKNSDLNNTKFRCLQNEIILFYGDENIYKALLSNPSEGMRCIVRSDTNTWERATIEKIRIAPQRRVAKCFLVDKIKRVDVATNRLYCSPDWVWKELPIASKFSLDGVIPVCLKTDYLQDKVSRSESFKWTPAAVEYFEKMIKKSNNKATVECIRVDNDGTEFVRLYVTHQDLKHPLCVNDILIKNKLALVQSFENRRNNMEENTIPKRLQENGVSTREITGEFQKRMDELRDCLSNLTGGSDRENSKSSPELNSDHMSCSSFSSDDKTIKELDHSFDDNADNQNNCDEDFLDIPVLSSDCNGRFSPICSRTPSQKPLFSLTKQRTQNLPKAVVNSNCNGSTDCKENPPIFLPNLKYKTSSDPPKIHRFLQNGDISNFPVPISRYAENPNPVSRYAENPNPVSRYAENHNPVSKCAENPNPVSRYAENHNPVSRYAENPNPVSRYAENHNPVSRCAENPNPVSRYAENHNPVSRCAENPNPASRYAENPNPVSRYAENPNPVSRYAENPNPVSRCAENPNPVSRYAENHNQIRPESPKSELERDPEILKLKRSLESHDLDRITAAKLRDILSMSSDDIPPGRISIRTRKLLLLERLLNEVEERIKTIDVKSVPKSKGRRPTVTSSQLVPTCSYNRTDARIPTEDSPKPKKKSIDKNEKAFFSSGGLTKSQPNTGAILVKGFEPPNPISLFCEAPFPSFVVSTMEKMGFRGPYCLQAHVWSAILKNRNVVGLAPAQGGKTLAYVAPLVSMLADREKRVTNNLNRLQSTYLLNQSPTVIVLCSTRRNVKMVTDCFASFFKHLDREGEHRVIEISGGPEAEAANIVNLLTGCSVLVCSPFTMIRLIETKHLPLARLEKLVLDDFHILVEEFAPQIRQIMTFWSETLDDPDRPLGMINKPQILCFGIQWTPGVQSFVKHFLSKPLLYISNHLESSVFGQVDHQVKMVKHQFLLEKLVHILKSDVKDRRGGIAVFVKDVASMKNLSAALKAFGFSTSEAHSNMPDYELQLIQECFDEVSTSPIMIICDNVLSIVDIDTIEVAIHYDFPQNPRVFGLRLALMRNFFHIKKTESSDTVQPRSYLFFSEKNFLASIWLVKFLTRLSKPISPLLKLSAEKAIESKESSKKSFPLCPFLQAYGRCRDANVCRYRHWISEKLDAPNNNSKYAQIPTSGHVRIYITNVKNATSYYGRLIRRKSDNKAEDDIIYDDVYNDISNKLKEFYSDKMPMLTYQPELGQLYGLNLFGDFYRVQVVTNPANKHTNTKDVCWKTPAGVIKTLVQLVDTGSFQPVLAEKLLELPPTLIDVPFQAIEIRSCNATPIDRDTEWLVSADSLVHKLIHKKVIEGKVVFALNNTIWLDPVVVRSKLPLTGIYVDDYNVLNELIESGLAEKTTNHLDNLREAIAGKISVVNQTESKKRPTVRYEPHSSLLARGDNNEENKLVTSNNNNRKEINSESRASDLDRGDHKKIASKNQSLSQVWNQSPHNVKDAATSHIKVESAAIYQLPPLSTIAPETLKGMRPSHNCTITSSYDSDKSISESKYDTISSRACSTSQTIKTIPVKRNKKFIKKSATPKSKVVNSSDSSLTLSDESDGSPTPTRKSMCRRKKISPFKKTPTNSDPFWASNKHSPTSTLSSPHQSVSKPSPFLEQSVPSSNPPSYRSKSSPAFSSYRPKSSPTSLYQSKSRPASSSQQSVTRLNSSSSKLVSRFNQTTKLSDEKILVNDLKIADSSDPKKELPPISDMNSNGVIYPFYVQLAHSDNVTERLKIFGYIYIQASQNPGDISEIDLESLNKTLSLCRNDHEANLVIYTMISLTSCLVSIEDFIDLSYIIKNFCVDKQPKDFVLPTSIITLCMGLLDQLFAKHKNKLKNLTDALITYLNIVVSTFHSNVKATSLIQIILQLLYSIALNEWNEFSSGDSDRLVEILSRISSNQITDELRKQLYNYLTNECRNIESTQQEPAEPPTETVTKVKKPKKVPPPKSSDPFNYDRFNMIDTTDSESSSTSRPYTPIPVRFDTDTDSASHETDTDSDLLPGL